MLGSIVPGGFGVTIFFVLSGYLITTLLRQEYVRYQDISFKGFYLRRALRLFPLLYLVSLVSALFVYLGVIEGEVTLAGMLSILFYWGNYYIALNHYEGIPYGLGVVWSLAIEEHFYLVWPLLFLFLAKSSLSRGAWAFTLIGLCAFALGLRIFMVSVLGWDGYYSERATETRFDSLMYGCLLAMVMNPWLDDVPRARPILEFVVLLFCVALLLFSVLYRNEYFRITFRYSVQSIALIPLFWLAVARHDWWPFRILNTRVAQYVGDISYSLYLVHLLVIFAVLRYLPDWGVLSRALFATASILAICEVLRRTIEIPLGRLRKQLHTRPAAAESVHRE